MRKLLILLALYSAPAAAQVSYPPFDTQAATKAVQDAVKASQDAAAAVAAMPPVCTGKPASDTYAGTVGTAAACVPRADSSRATQYQGTTTVTDQNGGFDIAWPVPFADVPIVAYAAVYGQSAPYLCSVVTKTATRVTGQCWALATTTLPSTTTALLNLVLSPFKSAAANLPITVTGRQ